MDNNIPTLRQLCINFIVRIAVDDGSYSVDSIPHFSLLPKELQDEIQENLVIELACSGSPERECGNCGAPLNYNICFLCRVFNR